MRTLIIALASVVASTTLGQGFGRSVAFVAASKPSGPGCAAASVSSNPGSVTCLTNSTVNFQITAAGSSPITYQWQTNSVNLADGTGYSGATNSSLWVSNAVVAQSNWAFRCIVSNACGVATSSVATLTVTNGLPPPALYPTNISGYPALAYYSADSISGSSNSAVASWPDQGSHSWNLSAVGSQQPTLYTGYLSGHSVVHFDGVNNIMTNTLYTCNQPHEIVMLLKYIGNYPSATTFICDGIGNGYRNAIYQASGNGKLYAGATLAGSYAMPEDINGDGIWFVINAAYNTTSTLYTNNASYVSGSAGAQNISGFLLANARDGTSGNSGYYNVAEIVTFATNLSSSARSGLYNYFRTNYPAASLPLTYGSPGVDKAGGADLDTAEASGLHWTNSVTSSTGENRLLVVVTGRYDAEPTWYVTNVTFAGASLTEVVGARENFYDTSATNQLWYLVAPASGASGDLVVDVTANIHVYNADIVWAFVTNANQSTPLGTAAKTVQLTSGLGITNTITGAAGDLMLNATASFTSGTIGTFTNGTGETFLAHDTTPVSGKPRLAITSKPGAASVEMSYTNSSAQDAWSSVGVAVKARQ